MAGGQWVFRGLGLWLGLLSFGLIASAQERARESISPLQKSRFQEIALPGAKGRYYFGIMGQVARPGVYELAHPQVQLLELIRHAGGLTQQATNQLRIVRQENSGQLAFYDPSLNYLLIPGDIVVADGPLPPRSPNRLSQTPAPTSDIQTADFAERALGNGGPEPVHVALMGLLDRPVILPVPPSHANLPAVLTYLGQAPGMTSQVKVLPVGRRGTDVPAGKGAAQAFAGPTVLYFNSRQIIAESLPKFPDVYRPEEQTLSTPKPEEMKTAEILPAPATLPPLSVPALNVPPEQPSTLPRLSLPVPHPEVLQPAPSATVASEPPMISSLRELEQQIPSPEPAQPRSVAKVSRPAPTPLAEADLAGDAGSEKAAAETSSWWPILGWVLLGMAGAGICVRLRRTKTSLGDSAEMFVPVLPDEPKPLLVPEPRREPHAASPPHVALDEDILTALVFNQLPIVEETPEPKPQKAAPAPKKVFRVDPPEEHAKTATKTPYILNRPKPKAVPEQPAQTPPKKQHDPPETLSLLDRALQRVNERKAA